MNMWCRHCQKAVGEPEVRHEYNIPDANSEWFEKITTYHCPDCGNEVYLEPSTCVMCGENIEPDKELCNHCYTEIHETLNELSLQMDLPFDKVLDGVAEYMEE